MTDQPDRIRDIPSIKEMERDLSGLRAVAGISRFAGGLLKRVGINLDDFNQTMRDFDFKKAEQLVTIPDRFNDLFVEAPYGWVIYDSLNFDLAVQAVELGEAGRHDEVNDLLIAHYTDDHVESQLRRMTAVLAFRPRMRLAEQALGDFKEGRYHASIPVVLAQADGLINELSTNKRGLFAKDATLTVIDSMTAHKRGLERLISVLSATRNKTTTEPIRVPYRNGILHGMDTVYDTREVAAKTWALLFAVRDFALRLEHPREPKTREQPSFRDLMKTLNETAELKRWTAAWKPRQIEVGVNVPASGVSPDYTDGTPEKALVEFFELWKQRNYGHMAASVSALHTKFIKHMPQRVRETYSNKTLVGFSILRVHDEAPAVAQVLVALKWESGDTVIDREVDFRMLAEDDDGQGKVAGMPGVMWKLITWEVW